MGSSFLSNQFLLHNYNDYIASIPNIIFLGQGYNEDETSLNFELFNNRAIQYFDIDLSDIERGVYLSLDIIPDIYSLEGVEQIFISCPLYWDKLQLRAYSEGGFLGTPTIVNPPNVFWQGYDLMHWMLTSDMLESGRFPNDDSREVTISKALLEKHFNFSSIDSSNPIGMKIEINDFEYEIVGTYYENLIIISNFENENFGFLRYNKSSFENYIELVYDDRMALDWWNPDIPVLVKEMVLIVTEPGAESNVLRHLLSTYPDANYYSHIFSSIYIDSRNRETMSTLYFRTSIQILIGIILSFVLINDVNKNNEVDFEFYEILYLDKRKIRQSYQLLLILSVLPIGSVIILYNYIFLDFGSLLLLPTILSVFLLFISIVLFNHIKDNITRKDLSFNKFFTELLKSIIFNKNQKLID